MSTRNDQLTVLAKMIHEVRLAHPTRVGIDGVDCSGKTHLADELVLLLLELNREVRRVSIDGFHNPRAIRYRQGRLSPRGFYEDTFDQGAIIKNVLKPLGPGGDLRYNPRQFDFRTDTPVEEPWQTASPDSIVLFDGIFLHRPELLTYWDFTIFVHADFGETTRRARERDQYLFGTAEDVEEIYRERYIPGQRLYLDAQQPHQRANVVLYNDDFSSPILKIRE